MVYFASTLEAHMVIKIKYIFREFQPMMFVPDDSSLLLDQSTNRFLVEAGIEPQIFYSTIRDFTS